MLTFADPGLPAFRSGAGWTVAATLAAVPLAVALDRAGPAGAAAWASPVCLLGAAWLALRRLPRGARLPCGAVPASFVLPGLACLAGSGLITLSSVDALARWFPPSPLQVEAWSRGSAPGFLLAAGIAGPVAEEVWFRGVVLRGALARHRPARAQPMVALLFGAAHLDPYAFVSHAVAGWVFGRWAAATGSLVPSTLGHVALNLVFLLPSRGSAPDPVAIGAGGWSAGTAALDAAGLLAGAALVGLGLRRIEKPSVAGD